MILVDEISIGKKNIDYCNVAWQNIRLGWAELAENALPLHSKHKMCAVYSFDRLVFEWVA